MLSPRATEFLKTLQRQPAIPTPEVEVLIRDQGFPCFAPWLDFHERYAGYVERFGRDGAVWGLIHEHPQWLLPRKADVDREPNEDTWYITCADAHPSYNYRLDNAGEFLGTPAVSFDVHVERIAVGWDFDRKTNGQNRALSPDELRSERFKDTLQRMEPFLVPEASDRYFRYYMSDSLLLVVETESGKIRKGRERLPGTGS